MADIPDIRRAIEQRLDPTITLWSRLEGRPRAADFGRSLRAEVRDALWMLSRQWQFGEFVGDDAGSPISAKLRMEATSLARYRPGTGPAVDLDLTRPLETTVERRRPQLGLDLRLAMGRRWLRLIAGIGYADDFTGHYRFALPDPDAAADAATCAHPAAWAAAAAVAERAMDGGALYEHLTGAPGAHAYDGIATIDPNDYGDLDTAARRFVAWFRGLIDAPAGDDAWDPSRLEYAFAVSAPEGDAERVLAADGFGGGHLDWPSVDVAAAGPLGAPPAPATGTTTSRIPAPVAFDGMPNLRYWAFEDGRTNLGDLTPGTTDLAKLLFAEFALVFANDWFVVPCELTVGEVARVAGMTVTTTFGERFWIEPAGSGAGEAWQRWSLFDSDDPQQPVEPRAFPLLPATPKTLQGEPLEEAVLIRDEMANMVWGIETTVPLVSGDAVRGVEAARRTRAFYRRLAGAPDEAPVPGRGLSYEAMSEVPENWIPFVPVHVPGQSREIQLQRAALPRIIPGAPGSPAKIRPLTSLLRVGLDQAPAEPYFVHEEEVPRAGTRVSLAYRRTRWFGGRVIVWLGATRTPGRGEGSSGLAFDRLVGGPENGG